MVVIGSPIMRSTLLLVLSSLALAGRSDAPKFAVEEKSSLSKSFENHLKLESKDIKIFVEGHDEPIRPPGDIHVSIEDTTRIEVTDEYLEMSKGRPAKLRRTFDKLQEKEVQTARSENNGNEDDQEGEHEKKQESALEGKTVLFTWNDDTSAFVASFPKDGGDPGLLEDLTEDMDFRSVLPKGKVADGESWDVDAKAFDAVLDPGGDLKLEDKEKDADEDSDQRVGKEIRKHLTGKAHATWKGVREEDGKKLGAIAVSADLSSEGDADSKSDVPGKTHFKLEIELEGELLWDLAAGHFHSFQATGKVRLDTISTAKVEIGERTAEMRQELGLEGEGTFKASLR
jgi:hypothetical protein